MRKWRVTLPGNKHFEMESDNPSADLTAKGYDAFGLTEITGLNIVETASRAPEEPMSSPASAPTRRMQKISDRKILRR